MRSHTLHPGAIQGKEGFKICYLATLQKAWLKKEREREREGGEEKQSWRNIRLLYNLFVVSLEKENERGTWNRRVGIHHFRRDRYKFNFPPRCDVT